MANHQGIDTGNQPLTHPIWGKEEIEAAKILVQLRAGWTEDEMNAAHAMLQLQGGASNDLLTSNSNDPTLIDPNIVKTSQLVDEYGVDAVLATFEVMFDEETTADEDEIVRDLERRLKGGDKGKNGQ